MKLGFIIDPLGSLKPAKDSSIAMMRAAAARGHAVTALAHDTMSARGGEVSAYATPLQMEGGARWCTTGEASWQGLDGFDAVLMRQDPPFDAEYVAATWLLERAEDAGARVFNRPGAIRNHSEKAAILEFPELTAPTLVSRDAGRLQAFIEEMGDAVLKPLDGMGGAGIFRVRADDPNRNVIVETLNGFGARTVMAQQYLPAIREGDKRVLIIGGEPVPFALARIPQGGDLRGNLAAGGRGEARPLTPRDRAIADTVAERLAPRGLLLIGIDVIGDCLTEINVTSPTCFVEITAQTGFDVAARFIDALEFACT